MKQNALWTAANVVMLLMFAFSVAVQFNDPDPIAWILIYGLAAAACFLEVRRKTPWMLPASIGVAALIWAGTISPRVIGVVPFMSMFEEFEMKDVRVEESREMYGLILIAAWMLAIAYAARRRSQAPQPASATR